MMRSAAVLFTSLLAGVALSAPLAALQQGVTTLMSVSTGGTVGDQGSIEATLSPDGRYVAFTSGATNLVATDINGATNDVFVRDRQTGQTVLGSLGTGGAQPIGPSGGASLSNGAVAFFSYGDFLVPGDTNNQPDIFVRELASGVTTRVSVGTGGVQANSFSNPGDISADGRFVVFDSFASNLAPAGVDMNDNADVFRHDRQTGVTILVSINLSGTTSFLGARTADVSDDGRYVSFWSQAGDLVAGDSNGSFDVFVRDLQTGTTVRASVGPGGAQANGSTAFPSLSGNGRCVVFTSTATNLVAGDTNGAQDVFRRDLLTGTTARVSVSSSGAQSAELSYLVAQHALSADGNLVCFASLATDLVPQDTHGATNIFVRDMLSGVTYLASAGPGGDGGNHGSESQAMGASGNQLVFTSNATNLGPVKTSAPSQFDAFFRDSGPWKDLGSALGGVAGAPSLIGSGVLLPGSPTALNLGRAAALAPAVLFVTAASSPVPFKGGVMLAVPALVALPLGTSAAGEIPLPFAWPAGIPGGTQLVFQYAIHDAAAVQGVSLTNAERATAP